MKYIYKLVDEKGLEMANKGLISLSRPVFSFKGSEGHFINFAKNIMEKYLKNGLNISPTLNDLAEIDKWIEAFKKTSVNYTDYDIMTEASIIFCGIFQGFCGYFTNENLDDEKTLALYLKNNKLKDKIAYIKISNEVYNHLHWNAQSNNFEFEKCYKDNYDLQGYNGFLHPNDVSYLENHKDYLEIFKIFNSDKVRSSKHWFTILSSKYKWQNEKRLVFLLRSLKPNSSTIACKSVYKINPQNSNLNEVIFEKLIDTIYYSEKSDKYIYLKIDPKDIKITEINKVSV